MDKTEYIKEMAKDFCLVKQNCNDVCNPEDCCQALKYAEKAYEEDYRKQSEWISVEDRLPTTAEYLTHHKDGLDNLKRITIAHITDTVEYAIGCYDGYKWLNRLGNRIIKDVIAWKPFEMYEPPKMKGGAE